MKTLKLIALAAFALLFSQCKTTAPTAPGASATSVSDVFNILDTTQNKFFQYADSTNGDPWKAIMQTAAWLQTQPNVQSVETLDSVYIRITLKSGLQTIFHFDQVDANGRTMFRGGGRSSHEANTVRLDPPHILSTNTITNKKVLIFSPPYDEFYAGTNEMQKVLDLLNNSPLSLDVTLLKNEECAFDVVNTFNSYGMVILDTHGAPDGFMVGGVDTTSDLHWTGLLSQGQFKTIADNHAGIGSYNKIISGDITIEMSVKVNPSQGKWFGVPHQYLFITFMLDAKYLSTIPDLSKTIVFGNMCYSGWNVVGSQAGFHVVNPIRASFLAKNPISYYCYTYGDPNAESSRAVQDNFAHQMEDSLLTQLVTNLDSTGHGYLKSNGTKYYDTFSPSPLKLYLNHFGADDYSYDSCGGSFTDARDGQVYKTVCIGTQKWMAQNLNYNAQGSYSYNNDPANEQKYGRLYPWTIVMGGASATNANPSGVRGICPNGWHLPSSAEWMTLLNTLGGQGSAGGALKSTDKTLWNQPNVGATNSSGFSALPGGKFSWVNIGILSPSFDGLGSIGLFHSTSLSHSDTTVAFFSVQSGSGAAIFPYTVYNTVDPNQPPGNVSCRCVKDP